MNPHGAGQPQVAREILDVGSLVVRFEPLTELHRAGGTPRGRPSA